MENNHRTALKSFGKGQGENTDFKAEIHFLETVIRTENIKPQRVVLLASIVWIKDENGNIRQTEQGTQYKVNVENGQISFDKPLKFKQNG